MDSGQGNLALLILLVVAVLAFIKLRSVLGRRTGDEPARYERYRAAERAAAEARAQREASAPAKGASAPPVQRDTRSASGAVAAPTPPVDRVKRMTEIAAGNDVLARSLIEVANADPAFDPAEFLRGAKAAYETIVTAFAAGDKAKLHGLLADDVLHGFSTAIDERASQGHHIDQSFVGIRSADFTRRRSRGRTSSSQSRSSAT